MLPTKLVFVDIETTGGSVSYDRIIEIAILRVEEGKLVETYSTLINPERHLPEEIVRLTGICADELASAPTFAQIQQDILDRLQDSVFVAHNVRFDYGFVKQELFRNNTSYTAKHLCTVKLSRKLYPRFTRHNLDSVIERCGISCEHRHRALGDAQAIFDFYQHALANFPQEKVVSAIDAILKKPSLPPQLSLKKVDALPELPGVYIFYGESGMPLYVGKSVNIRDRVLSHFTNDLISPTEMKISRQVRDIEVRVTSGELSALLLEAETVKKLQPLYNRKLRKKHRLIVLKKKLDESGYFRIQTEEVEKMDSSDVADIVGVFRSKSQAKTFLIEVAKKFELCEILLGTEKSKGPCFAYRLGQCHGACTGKEKPHKYNARFLEAFANSSLEIWPYSSPVCIQELDQSRSEHVWHLVDKWCYLGKIRDGEGFQDVQLQDEVQFDLDLYKILRSFLKSHQHSHVVRPVEKAWLQSLAISATD